MMMTGVGTWMLVFLGTAAAQCKAGLCSPGSPPRHPPGLSLSERGGRVPGGARGQLLQRLLQRAAGGGAERGLQVPLQLQAQRRRPRLHTRQPVPHRPQSAYPPMCNLWLTSFCTVPGGNVGVNRGVANFPRASANRVYLVDI